MIIANPKNMKRLLAISSLLLLLAACHNEAMDPVITGYRMGQLGGLGIGLGGVTTDMSLEVDVTNPSSARYVLESLEATLYPKNDTTRFADVVMKESVSLEPRSEGTLSVPLSIRFTHPLSLLSRGLGGSLSDYEADVDLLIRKGAFKKKIHRQRLPLDQIEGLLRTNEKNEYNEENQ